METIQSELLAALERESQRPKTREDTNRFRASCVLHFHSPDQFLKYLESFDSGTVMEACMVGMGDMQRRLVKRSEFVRFVYATQKALKSLEWRRKTTVGAEPEAASAKKSRGASRVSPRRREAFRLMQETGSYEAAYIVDKPNLERMATKTQLRAKAAFRKAFRRFRGPEKKIMVSR
jgi:hypothetical protein